jgi:hypothetical protein
MGKSFIGMLQQYKDDGFSGCSVDKDQRQGNSIMEQEVEYQLRIWKKNIKQRSQFFIGEG